MKCVYANFNDGKSPCCTHDCKGCVWCDEDEEEEGECNVCANADNEYCFACDNGNQFKPITNADRIRAMTDEELAEYLDEVCHNLWQMFVKDPRKMWLDWLKKEAKEDE